MSHSFPTRRAAVLLGASGVTHGLGFMLFALGVLRRDRAAIAAGMIAFMFYGGMILTVLPREPGISWQAHLGGALAGLRSEEHTSELQSLMRISYAVFCLQKKQLHHRPHTTH